MLSTTEIPRVFIGYDPAEAVAYNVLCESIQDNASGPVLICPLRLTQLQGLLTRARDPLQSNDFSFSRWLVPFLCKYSGFAVFMDCDMLVTKDIYGLWALRDQLMSVQVVQNEHNPTNTTKYLGNKQTSYPMKNWSSVMLFNNVRCRRLTRDYVNEATGLDLHQFKWCNSERIGALPLEWNHLVGVSKPTTEVPANIHWTDGGPYFHEYQTCQYSSLWWTYFKKLVSVADAADSIQDVLNTAQAEIDL